jgi:hypothetical protein
LPLPEAIRAAALAFGKTAEDLLVDPHAIEPPVGLMSGQGRGFGMASGVAHPAHREYLREEYAGVTRVRLAERARLT